MAGVACGAVLVRKGRDQGDNNIEGKPSMEATRVDVFEWSKVHDRESLARPDPVIWPVESDRVEETGLRNNSDNSVGFTCGYEHRAGLEQTGELRTPGQTSTNSGHGDAARSRDGTGNRSKEQVRSLQTYLSILHTVGTRTGRNCRPPMRLHRSTTRVMRLGLTEMKWLAGLPRCHMGMAHGR
jgi:hypothetical protein